MLDIQILCTLYQEYRFKYLMKDSFRQHEIFNSFPFRSAIPSARFCFARFLVQGLCFSLWLLLLLLCTQRFFLSIAFSSRYENFFPLLTSPRAPLHSLSYHISIFRWLHPRVARHVNWCTCPAFFNQINRLTPSLNGHHPLHLQRRTIW